MNKLLDLTLRKFIRYAALVLLCSIPAYYLLVDLIWKHELKEHNRIVGETVKQNLQKLALSDQALQEKISLWNQLRPETKIAAADQYHPDSTYNIYRRNKYIPAKGLDRFQVLVTYFAVNGKYYSITVENNIEESYETVLGIAVVTFLFFFIMLGGFILINRRISSRLWQPFYNSLEKIRTFDLQQQQPVFFEPTGIAEFHTLNNNLEKLIAANIATYQQQKEFTENASHELQTPLAIAKSKLDMLLQSHPLTAEQSKIIDDTHHSLSKVTLINKNLLLLAKLDNRQFSNNVSVNLSALLQDQILLFRELAADKHFRIKQKIAPEVLIAGNTTLVEIMATNLLMNVIKHSKNGATVYIELSHHHLQIINSGTSRLRENGLFKRFGAASVNVPGTGLGLAIIQKISDQSGWTVTYKFENNSHSFCIDFNRPALENS